MKKMTPMFLILVISVLGGLAVLGSNQKKSQVSTPTPSTYPSTQPQEGKISLTISSPANGSTAVSQNIIARGQTVPGGEVFINDASGKADANGYFALPVALDQGDNTISITVNDENGNSAETEITVSYNPST